MKRGIQIGALATAAGVSGEVTTAGREQRSDDPVRGGVKLMSVPELTAQIWRERCEDAQKCQAMAERLAARLREKNREYARVNWDLTQKLKNRDARIAALEELLAESRALLNSRQQEISRDALCESIIAHESAARLAAKAQDWPGLARVGANADSGKAAA